MPTFFQPLGPDHWAVLGGLGAALVMLAAGARVIRRWPEDRLLRLGLAWAVVANEVGSWGVAFGQGRVRLPCQLCDLAVFLMAWALLGKGRLVGEVAVCWGLAGSLQAVFTPDLAQGFPTYAWMQFFLGHGLIVLSAMYLLARGRVRLTMASVWRVWLVSNAYAAIAGLLNWRLGENFGYLARKPAHPSLLDYLGPWPVYLIGVEILALGLFWMCVAAGRLLDRWAGAQG